MKNYRFAKKRSHPYDLDLEERESKVAELKKELLAQETSLLKEKAAAAWEPTEKFPEESLTEACRRRLLECENDKQRLQKTVFKIAIEIENLVSNVTGSEKLIHVLMSKIQLGSPGFVGNKLLSLKVIHTMY